MWPFNYLEKRSAPDVQFPMNGGNIFELFGGGQVSASDVVVNEATAMRVPAYACGINFLTRSLASLPLQVFDKTKTGRARVKAPMAQMLQYAVNDEMSSFDWRKGFFYSVFTHGRGLTYIERNSAGKPVNLFNLDPLNTTIKRQNGRKVYEYTENGKKKIYSSAEIVDVAFSLKSDGISHLGTLHTGRDVLGRAIAATEYGSRFLAGGGVPPFVVTGNFQSEAALKAASDDLMKAVRKAASEKRHALTLPNGLEVKSIGVDPEKSQLIETERFLIEEIARVIGLPPMFLQDLTHGTFTNTEQQDLQLVKHYLSHWATQFEQELNLKLFGRANNKRYAELNMDGVLRGDFKTRMEGYARAIQTGIIMPSEARDKENRTFVEGSDKLFMQGATVPIEMAGAAPEPTPAGGDDEQ